ncbi:MAG: helix-turn-helix domain-containing protein [Actinomycetota bacterium]|nr:helix-turn-helix domain-containing protein [Actinomycetota bacterium]
MDTPPGERPPPPPLPHITDPRAMRALSHPVRLALLEALGIYGPMTATEVGERIGESPTTCSFHLRQLAQYGFVEEAGGGKGRARPWRTSARGMSFSNEDADPNTAVAAQALARLMSERHLARYQHWTETRAAYPPAWREAATHSEFVMFLTPDELGGLVDELVELLRDRYAERRDDPESRPAEALPVELLVFGYPIAPPPPKEA